MFPSSLTTLSLLATSSSSSILSATSMVNYLSANILVIEVNLLPATLLLLPTEAYSLLSSGGVDSVPLWVVDSGCTQFMCNIRSLFSNLTSVNVNIKLGDHSTVQVLQEGDISLFGTTFRALYTPSFRLSLISVPDLDCFGFHVVFANKQVVVMRNNIVRGVANLDGVFGLYVLDLSFNALTASSAIAITDGGVSKKDNGVQSTLLTDSFAISDVSVLVTTRAQARRKAEVVWKSQVSVAGLILLRNRLQRNIVEDSEDSENNTDNNSVKPISSPIALSILTQLKEDLGSTNTSHLLGKKKQLLPPNTHLWHARLGHINDTPLNLLLKSVFPNAKAITHCNDCVVCGISKSQERTGKGISVPRSLILYGRVHSDVCGPISTPSIGGSKYYAVFVKDSTRWTEVAILQKRLDLLKCWVDYRC